MQTTSILPFVNLSMLFVNLIGLVYLTVLGLVYQLKSSKNETSSYLILPFT